MPELWKFVSQLQEIIPFQPECLDCRTAANRGIARPSGQQRRFSELRPWSQETERKLLPRLVHAHDVGTAGSDYKEGIGGIVLFGDEVTELISGLLEQLMQPPALFFGHKPEER